MLGLADGWIAAAYLLCLISSLICVVYGAMNWNKGNEATGDADEDRQWSQEEEKIDEEL